ncbi:DeoR/GlpR family DNA-binding transcription regulator [Cohnella sp.]|uniref:DeoR/GlpR family DNA-binding transcription regulator n=1 Tax=Cohnella sp. TaxID=1883426 RepID=UPI003562DA75
MFQEERLLKILENLNVRKEMSVHDICKEFEVSRDTARRDIVKLVEEGAAMRTHGGITLPTLRDTIRDYRQRLKAHSEEKMLIGQRALSFIQEGKQYFFDVSTTVRFLAEFINHDIQVYTHSLDIAEILSDKDKVFVYLSGGSLHKENRFLFDAESLNQLKSVRFDTAFIGAAAIMKDGIYYENKEDAIIKKTVAGQSNTVILLADIHKFQLDSYHKGLGFQQVDILITDQIPPEPFQDILNSNNIQVIVISKT